VTGPLSVALRFDSLLQAYGVVKHAEIRDPQQLDVYGEKCLPAVKNGLAMGTTVGRANGPESLTRVRHSYGIEHTSIEIIAFSALESVSAHYREYGAVANAKQPLPGTRRLSPIVKSMDNTVTALVTRPQASVYIHVASTHTQKKDTHEFIHTLVPHQCPSNRFQAREDCRHLEEGFGRRAG